LTKEDLNDTTTVKVKGINVVFRRMLNKENELESKTRIVCGDCYIDCHSPSVVWRQRGKKSLRLVDTLSMEDMVAVKLFFQKVLPKVEKMPEEQPITSAPPKSQVQGKDGNCIKRVAGGVVKCPDYADCWDGIYLRENNKCGYKGTSRPRSAPTAAAGYLETAKAP